MFPYHTNKDHISHVTISVAHLAESIRFYTDIIQLDVIDKNDAQVILGSKGVPLLTLVQTNHKKLNQEGLFHVALLLQSEVALANWLTHNRAYLDYFGYSDHMVSQAVYLHDPDNNGIEIYSDRDSSVWTKTSDAIVMDTLPLDIKKLFLLANTDRDFHFKLGHLHLKTRHLETMEAFFNQLGFQVTSHLHGARFMSFHHYHHHVAFNNWRNSSQPYQETSLDIQSYTITYYDHERYQHIVSKLKNLLIEPNAGNTIALLDPMGIRVELQYGGETHENI